LRKLELIQPCDFQPADGEATDDPLVHACRACGHTVRSLSEMKAVDALAFLDRRQPGECVRFRVDERERILFADGPSTVVGRLARGARPMISAASIALAACNPSSEGAPAPAPETRAQQSTAVALEPAVPVTSVAAVPPVAPSSAVAATASATPSAAPSASGAPGPHPGHAQDRVVGKTKSGQPIVEMGGY